MVRTERLAVVFALFMFAGPIAEPAHADKPKAGQARNPTFTNMRAPCAQIQHKDTIISRQMRVG